jgi:glycosyl transferase family 25
MHTFIINLERRTDRKTHMLTEISKLDCDTYEFIPAVNDPDPKVGCNLSHQYCIRLAKERDLDYVLILEDDVIFEDNVNDILEKALSAVHEYEWNLLYLGGNLKEEAFYMNEHLLHVTSVNTTHAYIIHKRFYDTVLELPTSTIIDYHYRRLASTYNMYMCAPMVAYQMPSHSDLCNGKVDYSSEMKINFNRLTKNKVK